LTHSTLFIYLDAHWGNDLPLAEELEIVFGACEGAIVMVDEFEVPFDAGYGFDDYGPGKALTAAYIEPAIVSHSLGTFYPSTPSASESGARRGCVVLAKYAIHGPTLSAFPLLRSVNPGARS
jgi:hypothetical protein